MYQEEIDYLEGLLIAGDFTAAAAGSAALLHSAAEQGCRPLSQQRLMFVVLQSHFYAERQSELMEQFNRDFEGILGLPVQAFLLWQLLELEVGGAGSLRQCHAQTLAFLQQLAAVPHGKPMCEDSTSDVDNSQQQYHQAHAADQESEGSTHMDVMALCQLFVSDITCQGLQDFSSALAFLGSGTAKQLLQPQDRESLRAKVSEAGCARVLYPPGAAEEVCSHSCVAQRQVCPSAPAGSAPAESSPCCTMVGELDELDAWPRSDSTSTPANSRAMRSQGLQGHSPQTGGDSVPHAPAEQCSVAQSQNIQGEERGLALPSIRGAQLWAAKFAESTVEQGKALLAAWDRGSSRSMEPVQGGGASSSNSEEAKDSKTAWSSHASELALAAAVALVALAAYKERKAITDAARRRSRALRAAILDLGRMFFFFNSSGYLPAQR